MTTARVTWALAAHASTRRVRVTLETPPDLGEPGEALIDGAGVDGLAGRREQVARRVSVCFTPAASAATVRHSHILPPSSFCAQDEDGAKARGGPAGPGGDEVRQRYGDRDGEQHLGEGAGRVGEVGPGQTCAVPKLADSR